MAALWHIFGPIDELMAYGQKDAVALGQLAVVNVVFRFMSGFTGSYNFYAGDKEMQRLLIGLRIIGRKGEIYQEEVIGKFFGKTYLLRIYYLLHTKYKLFTVYLSLLKLYLLILSLI